VSVRAGGHCPTVGIGGFLLQGGMGWNCRGLFCSSLADTWQA
jgi:hypothetical protein